MLCGRSLRTDHRSFGDRASSGWRRMGAGRSRSSTGPTPPAVPGMSLSTRTCCHPTAPSPWVSGSRVPTAPCWPTPPPRAAPTGAPCTSETSRPAVTAPMSSSGRSSRTCAGHATDRASTTAPTPSPPIPSSRPTSTTGSSSTDSAPRSQLTGWSLRMQAIPRASSTASRCGHHGECGCPPRAIRAPMACHGGSRDHPRP